MRGAEGEPDSVLMIFEDVTERRANVVRLARLTRLYQVLSAVTEAIPEERDPDRLFEKVCGIVVAQGGFRRAWVGRKRRNGLVQVVASAGAEDAPGADGEEARALADRLGYVGVALAEGRSDTVQDVAADPRTAGMAAEAAALGIRSAAAVPVFIDGRHDTVLAIHSSEPGRFDAEELALLERLAADVGFAVQAGGEEAARRKAERRLEALNRSLERRVRERTDALEGANAELEAFSYSVSHDLRAPLRALDGFSLALLEDYGEQLDGDAADYLERIRAASQRMARLIDDLLMLSRVTRRDMTLEEVDLTALARAIGAELAADEPERKVTIDGRGEHVGRAATPSCSTSPCATCSATRGSSRRACRTRRSRVDVEEPRGRARVLRARQRRRVRRGVRGQAVRPVPAPARRGRVPGHGHRPGHRAAHRPPARRACVGRGSNG